jgi:hypothetical protein
MAFLRFSRDTRGYEHFYLVHPTTNRRGKVRPRLLYWFRTPPNVKVGRLPFDDAVRRALEAQNPDIQFDWPTILDTPIPPPVEPERWRERRRFERAARQAAAEEAAEVGPEPVTAIAAPLARLDSSSSSLLAFDVATLNIDIDAIATGGQEVQVSPSLLEDFGEPGKPDPIEDGELRCAPPALGVSAEPGSPDTVGTFDPRADNSQGRPPDAIRRRRRRRRGRRPSQNASAGMDQAAAPESGVEPQIDSVEPSEPEKE